jgi:hypothetical protein
MQRPSFEDKGLAWIKRPLYTYSIKSAGKQNMAYPLTLVFVSAVFMLVFPETFGNGYPENE